MEVREMSYTAWIKAYEDVAFGKSGSLQGRCHSASAEMKEAYPELEIVKGHVYCAWGKRGHVWLTDPDGNIVDPTAKQFPQPLEYEPWLPGMETRVGHCMNCGQDIWKKMQSLDEPGHGTSICSEVCNDEMVASLGEGRHGY